MAVNNNGTLLDSAGNPAVDFVWGNMAIQPNDQRTETAAVNIGGTTGSNQTSFKTAVVTAATSSGSGATAIITYTAANTFNVGQQVTITGLTTNGANLTNATINTLVGSAGAYTGFTVLSTVSVSDTGQTTAFARVGESSLPGVGADTGWSATTSVTGARLDFAGTSAYSGSNVIGNKTIFSGRHEHALTAWSGYPAYTPATGKFSITQATGDGSNIRYESFNFLNPSDQVNITGCGALNLSNATVATATRDYFTVANVTIGSVTNINNGIVERTDALTASDGGYVNGVPFINVISVLGITTALAVDALRDDGFASANITTAAATTNTATQPTQINVTTTTLATVTIAGGTTTWPVGTKVTIAAGTGIPTALVGTWTVTGGSGSTLIIAGSGWTVGSTGAITPGTRLTGTAGTIRTQSVAAGTASVALSATITITPWA
jgi:hypothetical protein